jgi:hypothetical protein
VQIGLPSAYWPDPIEASVKGDDVMDQAQHPLRLALATALCVISSFVVFATPAKADAGDLLGGNCDAAVAQPFLPWLDPLTYSLAPDGGFEQGASGWTLSGGARVVSGNEPWHVNGASDSVSLSLPAGARAVSPPICVGLLHPTVRFFARNQALLGLGLMTVEAEVDALGLGLWLPVGVVVAGGSFQPTLPFPLLANVTSPLQGESATARLRFTAVGGKFGIDDVYVDPFKIT